MPAGYEKKDVSVAAIVTGSVFTIVLVVIFIVLLDSYFVINKEKYIYENVLSVKSPDLDEIRKAEDLMLNYYGIINDDKGIYQIPINQAMQIVVEEYAKK